MSSLVIEIRRAAEWSMPKPDLNKLLHKAAAEIERLTAALQECAKERQLDEWTIEFEPTRGARIASAALTAGDRK